LTVLGDFVVNDLFDKYDEFVSLFRLLAEASAYIEQSNYYSLLSLDAPLTSKYQRGFEDLNDAIDFLTIADMLTTKLVYKLHGGVVSTYLTEVRKSLVDEFIEHRKLIRHYRKEMKCLFENFDEIAADALSEDRSIVDQIQFNRSLA
jgi:hypothetical protein